MEIFGCTIIRTCELRDKYHTFDVVIEELENKIVKLERNIADLEDKVWHQKFEIEKAEDAKNRAQRDRALTEHRYEKVCQENRHLEAEIKRMKERR